MKRLDTATKNAIIADRLSGIPGEVVGRKYGIHEASVARLVSQFRRQTDSKAELLQTAGDYRSRLKQRSIAAIDAGLDPSPDKYKAGNLGVSVMKGIGEFQEVSMVGVMVALNEPAGWKSTYRGQWEPKGQAERVEQTTTTPETPALSQQADKGEQH